MKRSVQHHRKTSRRRFLGELLGLAAGLMSSTSLFASAGDRLLRAIPKSGERLPAVGMGSWLTFAVGGDAADIEIRREVLKTFFAQGGSVIDSSPMYGTSEEVIGQCLASLAGKNSVFAASKVWTHGWQQGMRQMERSRQLWGIPRIDLMQVHNLLDYETHIETLKGYKAEGKIRYIGVTTSHGRRHDELRRIMQQEAAIDFVQFTYNVVDREAEQFLLPLAKERGLGVIINRPFRGGELFERVRGKTLPAWCSEYAIQNWAQFFLKFVLSHPVVTCAIPATSRVEHMRENMGALVGALPDASMRRRMLDPLQ